jgi:hypothetical protein
MSTLRPDARFKIHASCFRLSCNSKRMFTYIGNWMCELKLRLQHVARVLAIRNSEFFQHLFPHSELHRQGKNLEFPKLATMCTYLHPHNYVIPLFFFTSRERQARDCSLPSAHCMHAHKRNYHRVVKAQFCYCARHERWYTRNVSAHKGTVHWSSYGGSSVLRTCQRTV